MHRSVALQSESFLHFVDEGVGVGVGGVTVVFGTVTITVLSHLPSITPKYSDPEEQAWQAVTKLVQFPPFLYAQNLEVLADVTDVTGVVGHFLNSG